MPPLEALETLADFAAKHAEHIYAKKHRDTKRIEVLQAANRVYLVPREEETTTKWRESIVKIVKTSLLRISANIVEWSL